MYTPLKTIFTNSINGELVCNHVGDLLIYQEGDKLIVQDVNDTKNISDVYEIIERLHDVIKINEKYTNHLIREYKIMRIIK